MPADGHGGGHQAHCGRLPTPVLDGQDVAEVLAQLEAAGVEQGVTAYVATV
ncbi:hypothetical protein [Streptomyces sp. NPDC047985]|uniref:hypothetical protein n=1 Tax=unclassified Streptomyces TaxID=2593676 RepID=UPI0034173891